MPSVPAALALAVLAGTLAWSLVLLGRHRDWRVLGLTAFASVSIAATLLSPSRPLDWTAVLASVSVAVTAWAIGDLLARPHRIAARVRERREERFRRIVDTTQEGIWSLDADGGTDLVNRRMADLLGSSVEELRGRRLADFVVGEEARSALAETPIRRAVLDARLERKDGAELWARVNLAPMVEGADRYVGAVAMVTDVTEDRRRDIVRAGRRRVLEQLALGESLEEVLTTLCLVTEKARPGMTCSVLLLDQDLRLRLGAAPSLPSFFTEEIDGIEIGPDVASCGAAAYSGDRVVVEDVRNHPSWDDLRAVAERAGVRAACSVPIVSSTGEILATFGAYYPESKTPDALDLTSIQTTAHLAGIAIERRQTEEKLARAQALLLAAIEQSPAGILIADAPDVSIRIANSAALGLRRDSGGPRTRIPANLHPHNWLTFHPDGTPFDVDELPLVRAVLYGDTQKNVDVIVRRPDGHERWLLGNAAPVRNDEGEITAGVFVFPDVTDLKEAEHERETLVRQLEAKNEELERIFRATSHDLRSPLVNIDGFGKELAIACEELRALLRSGRRMEGELLDEVDRLVEEDVLVSLDYIHAGTARMDQLLKGLRRLSSVERVELDPMELDMTEIVREIVRGMQYQIRGRRAEVVIDPLPPCRGDAGQIARVFTNLLDNAIKYLDPERRGRIRVSGWVDGDRSRYVVEDNGVGIGPEHQTKIFDIFHRLDPNGPTPGEGLGLTILKSILERHDGEVRVESEPSVGSAFEIILPTVQEAAVKA